MDNFKNLHTFGDFYINTYDIENEEDLLKISEFGRAISAPIRLSIIKLLNKKPMTLSEIAKELDIQPSSAAFHLKILEDAKLIKAENNTSFKGSQWYSYNDEPLILIKTRKLSNAQKQLPPRIINIKIGDFIDAKVSKSCGMATEITQIMGGNANDIFNEARHDAQIIWSSDSCFFEYAISNDYAIEDELDSITLSLELCSEARGYNDNFPSDITISINDIELCVYKSLGDYGNRYGAYTPNWWYVESTKYGSLVTVYINNNGVFLNEKLVNKHINIKTLKLMDGNKTKIKFEVKQNSENVGGLNLFGSKFGDYNQDITFTAKYVNK